MYAEKTRAFISALPEASSTLFGCQSTDNTVERIGFLRSFETHQLFSGSKEQMAIALQSNEWLIGSEERQNLPGTTGHGEFILLGTPSNVRRRPVDPEQNEGGLPDEFARRRIGGLLPHICIPIL
jgi:hypothetical protein